MSLTKILYAEDYKLVAHYMKETLEVHGWRVDVCLDGLSALEKIESDNSYDLLLLDNSLPVVSGIELVQRARELAHRKETPIIILSASDCAGEARRAGADVFLKKPDDISRLVSVITRVLAERE